LLRGLTPKTPPHPPTRDLGRRERELLDAVYKLGRASVAEVRRQLIDPPSYSAVRTMLNLLETKGHLRHEREGLRYIYIPTLAKDKARVSALRHVVDTFFEGSVESVVVALLNPARGRPTPASLRRLRRLIDAARERDANR
jgi:predicted transcriptional regulator